MSYQTSESDFTQILHGYNDCDEQEKQWKATCAALELMKHTLEMKGSSDVAGFAKYNRVNDVAASIRKSLETSTS